MNERIKEFAELAELNTTLLFNKDKLENFAELIVMECINLLPDECQCDESKIHASWKIKQHFGVKP